MQGSCNCSTVVDKAITGPCHQQNFGILEATQICSKVISLC